VVAGPIVNVVLAVTAFVGITSVLAPLAIEPPNGLITADSGTFGVVNELSEPPPHPSIERNAAAEATAAIHSLR
jgi:hypothetical protein